MSFSSRKLLRTSIPQFQRPLTPRLYLKSSLYRTMSSSAPKLHQFVVYCLDKTDEECMTRRLGVREQHLKGAKLLLNKGTMKFGGALLTPESIIDGNERKMIGSMVVMEGESEKQIKDIIENDIYYTSGVWDPAGITIRPFVQASP